MRSFQKIVQELKAIVSDHRPGTALPLPPSLQTLDINGRKLAYVSAGLDRPENEGVTPVVLLHGFGGFFMDWPRVMAPLSHHTRVYAFDLPGWGFSEPDFLATKLEDQVAILNEFLTRMNLHRAIVCGLSFGGGVAWAAGAMNLSRIKRLVLLNPMPPHPLRYLRSPIYRSIFFLNSYTMAGRLSLKLLTKANYRLICRENLLNHRLLDSFYLDLAYRVMKQPKMPPLLAAHALGAKVIDWNDWEHRLAGCRIPVSILQAHEDKLFSLESSTLLHRLIPTSELIEIEKCGHAMVFDQHRKVSDFIIRHLERPAAKNSQETHLENSHESAQKTIRSER